MFGRKKMYKKGQADAMQAYEVFAAKQWAALEELRSEVRAGRKSLEEALTNLGDDINDVYDYLTSQEKAALYHLSTPMDIKELEDAEKRLLLAVLYQLADDEGGDVTEAQRAYIRSVQKYLEIRNPQSFADLSVVGDIDSLDIQKAFLQVCLEFFYLQDKSELTDAQEDFLGNFSVNRKQAELIENSVSRLYNAVGPEGVAEKYGYVPQKDSIFTNVDFAVSKEFRDAHRIEAESIVETDDYLFVADHSDGIQIHKESGGTFLYRDVYSSGLKNCIGSGSVWNLEIPNTLLVLPEYDFQFEENLPEDYFNAKLILLDKREEKKVILPSKPLYVKGNYVVCNRSGDGKIAIYDIKSASTVEIENFWDDNNGEDREFESPDGSKIILGGVPPMAYYGPIEVYAEQVFFALEENHTDFGGVRTNKIRLLAFDAQKGTRQLNMDVDVSDLVQKKYDLREMTEYKGKLYILSNNISEERIETGIIVEVNLTTMSIRKYRSEYPLPRSSSTYMVYQNLIIIAKSEHREDGPIFKIFSMAGLMQMSEIAEQRADTEIISIDLTTGNATVLASNLKEISRWFCIRDCLYFWESGAKNFKKFNVRQPKTVEEVSYIAN